MRNAILIFVLLPSCKQHQYNDARLVHADSLMQSHPDSALLLLQGIDFRSIPSKADHAYYALLLTQARDKNYIIQTSDSLINIAVHYYDSIEAPSMQAKAHFYRGSVYRDQNKCASAVREYFVSIYIAETTKDIKTLSFAYNNIGYIYYTQELDEEADSIYQITEALAIQRKDSTLWVEALTQQSILDIRKGRMYYDSAEQKLTQAFHLANCLRNNAVVANLNYVMATLYSSKEDEAKALMYGRRFLTLETDTMRCEDTYLLLGNAYYKCGQHDSARYFLNKLLNSEDPFIKSGSHMLLADITKKEGDMTASLELERLHSVYEDSCRRTMQSAQIVTAEKDIRLQYHQKENRSHIHSLTYGALAIISLLSCFALYWQRKHQSKTNHMKQQQKELEEERNILSRNYTLIEKELQQKETQIAELQQEIQQQQYNEERRTTLHTELNILAKERNALLKEGYQHSDISIKMRRIIQVCKLQDKSDEALTENDWRQLIIETNKRWGDITVHLLSHYPNLSQDDIRLCCLYLADLPIQHISCLLQCTRDSIYKNIRKENGIYTQSHFSKKLFDRFL